MSDLVSADKIEGIVGVDRHPIHHYARAVSAEETVYILHSHLCVGALADLRACRYSLALDKGIEPDQWVKDEPVRVMVSFGRLIPYDKAEAV